MDPIQVSAAATINHLLRQAGWARERLKPFAGRIARLDPVPFSVRLAVTETGEVAAAAPEATPDLTVRLTPGLALRLAARDETAWREIAFEGDAELAQALQYLARNLEWDFEEDLARLFGDVAAHRLAGAARGLARWGAESAGELARSLAEYWTEEAPLLARADDVREFNRAVDALRDDLARLEKRLELLSARAAAAAESGRGEPPA
jgi:ubiquinone biosynthesis protein UbiJ